MEVGGWVSGQLGFQRNGKSVPCADFKTFENVFHFFIFFIGGWVGGVSPIQFYLGFLDFFYVQDP